MSEINKNTHIISFNLKCGRKLAQSAGQYFHVGIYPTRHVDVDGIASLMSVVSSLSRIFADALSWFDFMGQRRSIVYVGKQPRSAGAPVSLDVA